MICDIIQKRDEYKVKAAGYQARITELEGKTDLGSVAQKITAEGLTRYWESRTTHMQNALDLYNENFSGEMWQEAKDKRIAIIRYGFYIEAAQQILWQHGIDTRYGVGLSQFLKVYCAPIVR